MKHPLVSRTLLWNVIASAWAIHQYVNREAVPPGLLLAFALVNIWLRFITKHPLRWTGQQMPTAPPAPTTKHGL